MSLYAAVDLALKEAVERSKAKEEIEAAEQARPMAANPRADRNLKRVVRELARDLLDVARRRR